MALRSPLLLRPHLFVLIHGGSGTPFALKLNLRKLSASIVFLGAVFLGSLVGSLCFFRELEINRKLSEKLLEMESREKLAATALALPRTVAANAGASAAPPQTSAAKPATEGAAASSTVNARIGELAAECDGNRCDVRLAMVPTRTGLAEGQLLLVLETEIPRIGAGNPTTQVRKRFYSYPGSESRDDLDQEALLSLERKGFRFSRALQTNAAFTIGKLLRPLAINIYVFDKEQNLVLHERKAIELEE